MVLAADDPPWLTGSALLALLMEDNVQTTGLTPFCTHDEQENCYSAYSSQIPGPLPLAANLTFTHVWLNNLYSANYMSPTKPPSYSYVQTLHINSELSHSVTASWSVSWVSLCCHLPSSARLHSYVTVFLGP